MVQNQRCIVFSLVFVTTILHCQSHPSSVTSNDAIPLSHSSKPSSPVSASAAAKLSPASPLIPVDLPDHLPNVPPQTSLKSMIKRRLRPGLGLGRGLVKATLHSVTKKAKNAIVNLNDQRSSRQAPGLVAGAIAYGLASLPLLTLPLLIASPLAISRVFKSKSTLSEEEKETEKITSSLNEIFNVAGEILKTHMDNNSSRSQTAAKIAQALGLHPVTLDEDKVYPISPGSNIGDALFHPGSFTGSGYSHPKYKQYIFKQGIVTTTPKPGLDDDGKAAKAKSLEGQDDHGDAGQASSSSSSSSSSSTSSLASSKAKDQLSNIAKEVLKTVSDGIKRFELDKSECKERLVCEVSQKYAGSSFKTWATALTHVLDLDAKVEKSKVGKNVLLRSLYRGARSSLSDRNCAELFPNCS